MAEMVGQQIKNSAKVSGLIEDLVKELKSINSAITAPKEPDPAMAEQNQKKVDRLGQNRGRPLFYPYVGTGAGQGPYVELNDGSVKIDLINGIGVNIMGHSHPRVMAAALRGALSDQIIQGNLQPSEEYLDLSDKLIEIGKRKSSLTRVWISTSGSMANENALKACRQKTNGARKIIAMNAAFAGRTTMMAEITDNPSFKKGLPEYHEVLRVPFYNKNDPDSIQKSFEIFKKHVQENEGDVCCFTFEPMQGEGGYNVAPREYFLPMLELCREKGIPVWLDEVQTFCRTGEFFAYETLDLGEFVDVCTVAKTLQSAATFFTEELNPDPGLIAGTFAASSAALAAGREILDILDNEGYMGSEGQIASIHKQFVGLLNSLNEGSCKGLLQDAGGLGLMNAVTPLDGSREKMMELLKVLYKNGLMTFGCGRGPFRLRFLLPAIMTEKDINVAGEILEKSILEMN